MARRKRVDVCNAIGGVLTFIILLTVTAPARERRVIIAGEGKSNYYSIVIPQDATPQERLAADELRKYIQRISGVRLPIKLGVCPGRKIFVAQARDGKAPGDISFTTEETDYDAFVVRMKGNDLYLIGANERAVLYAVYDFLERELGCRWLTFGERRRRKDKPGEFTREIEEYVPKLSTISVPAVNRREKADLKYRGFVCAAWYGNTPFQMVDWMVKQKLNYVLIPVSQYMEAKQWRKDIAQTEMVKRGFILAVGHHSFRYFLNPKKYFQEHPNWFPLIGGRRVPRGQFCLSHPKAVEAYTKNVLAFVREHPEVDIYALYPNDGYGWCECNRCTKGLPRWEERPKYLATTDLYLRLINPIQRRIRELHPGKRVGILAYVNYCQPPVRVKPAAGLHVMYAFFTRNWYTDPIGNGRGALEVKEYAVRTEINRKFILRWVELMKATGGDVMMYEYYAGRSAWRGVGFYLMHLIADELAYFKRIGLSGCAVQSHWNQRKTVPANLYVFAKACWDVDLDVDAVLEDYCRYRYGRAAQMMLKYLKEAEENSRHHLKYFVRGAKAIAERDKSLADCERYLDEAMRIADTERARKAITTERENFERLKAFQMEK